MNSEIRKRILELRGQRFKPEDSFFSEIETMLKSCLSENDSQNLLDLYVLKATGLIYKHDTEGIKNCYNQVEEIRLNNLDNSQIQAAANRAMGTYYWNFNDYAKALDYFQAALPYSENLSMKVQTNQRIGVTYYKMSDYKNAFKYMEEAYDSKNEVKDDFSRADMISWFGVIHDDLGIKDKALELTQEAITINMKINNENALSANYNTIGLIYMAMGYYEQALDNLQEAEKFALVNNSAHNLANAYSNIAMIYQKLNKSELAIDYYVKSVEYRKKCSQLDLLVITCNSLVNLYLKKEQLDKALEYAEEIQKISEKITVPKSRIQYLNSLIQIGLYQKEYDKVIEYLNENLKISQEINHNNSILKVYSLFSIYYEQIGDYKKALEYERLSTSLESDLNKTEEKRIIENLTMQHQRTIVKLGMENTIKEEKIKAVLAMAVTANHEINQPLALVRGNLDLLIDSLGQASDKQQKFIDGVNKGITRISTVLEKFRSKTDISFVEYVQNIQMVSFD